MKYTHYKTFIERKGFQNASDAFKEGVEVAFSQVESNMARISLKALDRMLRDCYQRSQANYEYAVTEDAKEFQLGYQAVCKHFLEA